MKARYRVFGLTLETSFQFRTPLESTGWPVDLRFECIHASSPYGRVPGEDPVFRSRARLDSGAPVLQLFTAEHEDVIRYTEVADFVLRKDRIQCHLYDPSYHHMVEIHLLGLVLSFWFERCGIPMLHASAVSVDGRAAVFLATNQGGKSSLAAALMQIGRPMLSDDQVGLQKVGETFLGRPGFRSMRLWPDHAARFHGDWEHLTRAHPKQEKRLVPVGDGGFGAFVDEPIPLAGFYLPERRGGGRGSEVDIIPVGTAQAVIELVRGSFVAHLVEAAGLAGERLSFFGRVAGAVPMKRLVYSDGAEHLADVARAVVDDLS